MSLLTLAWLTEVGLMTSRTAHKGRPDELGGGKVVWPADFVSSFVVFGALSVIAEIGGGWDRVAAATGWGFVLATVFNLVDPATVAQLGKPAGSQSQPKANPAAVSLGGTPA